MRTVIDGLERTYRSATVIYQAQWMTKKLKEPWGLASICGDVMEVTPEHRVVLDLGRNRHVIPAERHVRTVWGATVQYFYEGLREGFHGALVHDRIDVEGWTEPRHQELYNLVHNGSTKVWFAHFARRYGLAGKHWQWDEFVQKRSEWLPLNAGPAAYWLLKCWDREHTDVARRLHGIQSAE
ncbi:hypothetical protein [Streptomyces rimosus]|uniref:hypothetical protein n=1 Tax=Streptomyces rimosus TaxID=1927 RepID=UPI0004C818CF|nr:hypothetical protein [Streptomyces rimosus]